MVSRLLRFRATKTRHEPDLHPRRRRCRRPQALHRLSQLGARARPFRAADLSDRRDRAGGDLPAALFGADRAVDRGLRHLRCVRAAGRLARGPLEPPQHDGCVLYRLRRFARRRSLCAQSADARGRAVYARHVRLDLSSGRHGDADRSIQRARAHARLQRRLRQSRRFARRRHQRRSGDLAWLAGGVFGAGRGVGRNRHRLSVADAG